MSSAITPIPPGNRSICLTPKGLAMSKKRNRTNDAKAYQRLPAGAAMRGIHTPTISSTTTRRGSSPQKGITLLVAHTPNTVNNNVSTTVSAMHVAGGRNRV